MKKILFIILAIVLSLGMTSCKDKYTKDKNNSRDRDKREVTNDENNNKDNLSVVNSSTSKTTQFAADESFSPYLEALRKQYESLCDSNAQLTPIYTEAKDGLDQLMEGKVRLYFTSSDLTGSQRASIKQKLNIEPTVYKLGYEGVTLIVNKENNDTCISVRDVKRILSGEVANWSQIVTGSKRGDIKVVFDNPHSATTQYCVESILGGKPLGKDIVAAKNSQGVIDYVEKNPNAIGVIGSTWVLYQGDPRHLTFIKNINVMSISKNNTATPDNSYLPFQFYLLDGTYPFIRTIYAILVDGEEKSLLRSFAEHCDSEKGQLSMLHAGMLPYHADLTLK